MTGLSIPAGSMGPWASGSPIAAATCVLAPNASPMTLDGTNTWVLAAADGCEAFVIDPGPDDADHLHEVAALLDERSLRPLAVVLTHGHPDHSEGAATLASMLGCGVRAVDPAHRWGDDGLVPGSVLAADGVELHVVSTPGHTSDSVSLLLKAHDTAALVTGDTVLGRGTTVVAHPDGRLGDYLRSLNDLRARAEESSAAMVLPGHGPALPDPIAVIDYYLAHRAQRLEQVAAAVAEVSGQRGGVDAHDLAQDVVERVYADVSRSLWPAALLSVRAQLEYLREMN